MVSAYHADAIDEHGRFLAEVEEFAHWGDGLPRQTRLPRIALSAFLRNRGDSAHTKTYSINSGINRDPEQPRWAILTRTGRHAGNTGCFFFTLHQRRDAGTDGH